MAATPFSVNGKTAIVTGAGSGTHPPPRSTTSNKPTGICLSFASLLLSKNCNVLFADLALRPEAQKLIDSYTPKISGKPRAIFQKTDVRDWSQLSRLFSVADAEFDGVDIVCPGAGIYEPYFSNFWHPPGSPESKDPVDGNHYAALDINMTHPIRATQLALAHFLDGSKGKKASPANPKRVVHVSSVAGQCANLCTPFYIAGKHAINGFIRALGPLDEAVGVRVNGVAPGLIRTPLWTEAPEKNKFVNDETDDWATPEEVAEAMLRCMEDPELGGGVVLEVGKDQTRKVAMLNDPGPSGKGFAVSNIEIGYQEVFGWLAEDGWGQTK
jgi:NAD(P)-dependent dehydrogenase (short-subunit alcohol dehydrogenase family)